MLTALERIHGASQQGGGIREVVGFLEGNPGEVEHDRVIASRLDERFASGAELGIAHPLAFARVGLPPGLDVAAGGAERTEHEIDLVEVVVPEPGVGDPYQMPVSGALTDGRAAGDALPPPEGAASVTPAPPLWAEAAAAIRSCGGPWPGRFLCARSAA